MKVAFATSEMYPLAKTGGLADVSGTLPRALAQLRVDITVFMPMYRSAAEWLSSHGAEPEHLELPHKLWIGDEQREVAYKRFSFDGVQLVLVDQPWYYNRPHLYLSENGADWADNVARYAYFCRAMLEYCLWQDDVPDIFHVNDWQTSLIPVYLKTAYNDPQLAQCRTLLTLHNIGYQGVFPKEHLYATGLGWEVFQPDKLEFYDHINLLKGGVAYADAINTVSPTYAKEIQTEEQGKGLEGVFAANAGKLSGILNGIDITYWDPAVDPHLPAHYTSEDLSGKKVCKKILQRELSLPIRPRALVLGVVSRFDVQKGIDLIMDAFPQIAGADIQLAVLGSGNRELETRMRWLAELYPEQVAVRFGYHEPLAHLIEAGADCFLMPSRYEPCGLNQLYSQRYGTVPVVRETGGLKDTVANCTPKRMADGRASGFTFRPATDKALGDAIKRAARLYFTNKRTWGKLQRHIMGLDHSWGARAKTYLMLYEQLATAHAPSKGAFSE